MSTPDQALELIEPGMQIFLGTGTAEPRTLIKRLMSSKNSNLQDLTLIQILSYGNAISVDKLQSNKYRLKTFFSGRAMGKAIDAGQVDLIPSRFSSISKLFNTRQLPIDAAIVQVTPPDTQGICSLGIAVDMARQAMTQASVVIGEINHHVPRTFGDTFVSVDDFDALVQSTESIPVFPHWSVGEVFDQVAANVASVIEDGSCLGFTIGPLFDALPRHLAGKKDLGLHTPFMTDAAMALIKTGAVTNRRKNTFRGKSVTCYALGSQELYNWLDFNPLVEFQSIDKVFDPMEIGKNPRFVVIFPARRVDLSGRIVMHAGRGRVTAGPGQAMDYFNGAGISPGGFTIFALPSRNLKGESNIRVTVERFTNLINMSDSVNIVATEYGIASLFGRTVRERAQALIEIAHPDDRPALVKEAKEEHLLYPDQIFLADSAHLYPTEIAEQHTFKNNTKVHFRAIKPSDEEEMRRLFYRFSEKAIYYRYFTHIHTMPHAKMQEYVNIDYQKTLAVVGLVGPPSRGRIIAEARFILRDDKPYVEVAFIVDENYQGLGVATYLYRMLARLARQRGARGIIADVLATNQAMLKVLEKSDDPITTRIEGDVCNLTITFDS